MIKILTVFSILFLYACSNTSPTNVKTSDVQKITSIEYGFIKSSSPVKIKGESNWVGATCRSYDWRFTWYSSLW
jgi:outer membrane lipoprotein SlyB